MSESEEPVDHGAAGTAAAQGPVEIDEALADRLESKREDLFEKFELAGDFPPGVIEEAETRAENVEDEIAAEAEDRRDLRDLTTWTTDPVDAEDFDDAISIDERDDEYVLWVHIADVTHYVTPDTKMWDAAVERATTVYLPGATTHMLPPVLAETVCSLVPNEDRLAHTVEMHLDKETLSYDDIEIYKSVIQSDARLTYSECEELIDDPDAEAELLDAEGTGLPEKAHLVWEVADRLHQQRKDDGSLVLNPRRDKAHTIIEECMLKANKAVTHELQWSRGLEAMYRVHPQPSPGKWDEALREIQDLNGVSVPAESWDEPRKAVNATLEEAPGRQLDDIQWAVMKVMPRAKYMNDPFSGHHALNFEIYGHFTSPIRRLSDLINHWIVATNEVPENLPVLCDRASEKQQAAESCEREYREFLQEVGLDPNAVNNRGLRIVEE